MTVEAVVFDLDGVLVETEPVWADAKRALVMETGGRWRDDAPTAMLGMSGPEWSEYLRDELGVPLPAHEIRDRVVQGVLARLDAGVPLIPGASRAVAAIAARWPLALASSADRPVIDAVLRAAGLSDAFAITVTSDEAGRGKPAPDVYLVATERLGVEPQAAVAVEDSGNGIRAATAAGLALIAIPSAHAPLDDGVLDLASLVLPTIAELTPNAVERAAVAARARSAGGR